MANPPYWPYRCRKCQRFVSNPVCTFNVERITSERGDCRRCGPGVELMPLAWEDWFSDDFDVDAAIFGPLEAAGDA
jgi:hypothetical protein